MDIELKRISVRELFTGYVDKSKSGGDGEEGVVGYGGKLNIRPPYQREFVYKDKQRDAVVETVRKGFPLNTMYWVDNGDDTYDVLDGQQRTISICEYVGNAFSMDFQYFHNLTDVEQSQILNYELMVYFCKGHEREKLDWFKIINIAGEKLTDQELRNAIYTGPWLYDAKKHFSKTGGPAYNVGGKYLNGAAIRQDYLESAILWHSDLLHAKPNIEQYMADYQHNDNAAGLWLYFQSVISWVEATFKVYRKEMKGVPWGLLFNKYGSKQIAVSSIEDKVSKLMADEDVGNKKGIYEYLLSGDEHHLNIRAFSLAQKREAYERQQGVCPIRNKPYPIEDMHADHVTPWSKGGKTTAENCQMIHADENRRKGAK